MATLNSKSYREKTESGKIPTAFRQILPRKKQILPGGKKTGRNLDSAVGELRPVFWGIFKNVSPLLVRSENGPFHVLERPEIRHVVGVRGVPGAPAQNLHEKSEKKGQKF